LRKPGRILALNPAAFKFRDRAKHAGYESTGGGVHKGIAAGSRLTLWQEMMMQTSADRFR
jgi:hypothetical protein